MWTGDVVPRDGRLLDLQALARAVREVGDPFWVRGVEATIDGELVEKSGRWTLKVPGSGELFYLEPLAQKVQWDTRGNRAQPATEAELSAYNRLTEQRQGRSGRLRVVGPLVRETEGAPPLLQVRQFVWRP
jgi:hypothetical protein